MHLIYNNCNIYQEYITYDSDFFSHCGFHCFHIRFLLFHVVIASLSEDQFFTSSINIWAQIVLQNFEFDQPYCPNVNRKSQWLIQHTSQNLLH